MRIYSAGVQEKVVQWVLHLAVLREGDVACCDQLTSSEFVAYYLVEILVVISGPGLDVTQEILVVLILHE